MSTLEQIIEKERAFLQALLNNDANESNTPIKAETRPTNPTTDSEPLRPTKLFFETLKPKENTITLSSIMTTLEQIKEKEQNLLEAMLKSDVTALNSLISDDLLFTDHNGQVLTKTDDLESHRSGRLQLETMEPSEQVIRLYNDTAIVSVLMNIKGQYDGQAFEFKNRYSRVWANTDHSWKIILGHASMVTR